MAKSSTIGSIILGASIGVALLKFYNLPKEERDAFWEKVKIIVDDLLDDAENTVAKVDRYVDEIKSKGENNVIEKLYVVKKMLQDLFKTDVAFL